MMLKQIIALLLLVAAATAQVDIKTPLTNPVLRTDMDAGTHKLLNLDVSNLPLQASSVKLTALANASVTGLYYYNGIGSFSPLALGNNMTLVSGTLNSTGGGGSTLTAGLGVSIAGDVISIDKTFITGQPEDLTPSNLDYIPTWDASANLSKKVSFDTLSNNLLLSYVQDPDSGLVEQFDASGLTGNSYVRFADGPSVTVVPDTVVAGSHFGQIVSGIDTLGAMKFDFRDFSTLTAFNSDVNNWAPATPTYFMRVSSDSTRNVTGQTQPSLVSGAEHLIVCTSNSVVFKNENVGSTAALRYHTSTGSDITLTAGQMAYEFYDGVISRWSITALGGSGGGGGNVSTNITNTFVSGGTLDLSATTLASGFRLPTGPGAAPTTAGVVAMDTTSNAMKLGLGAGTATMVATTQAQTLTNKRNTARVPAITASATPIINTDITDVASITALNVNITSMTTNLTGTPQPFDSLIVRFRDDGTPRTIAWGASFVQKGVALPTTTVAGKDLTVGFKWYPGDNKWGCVASAEE